MKPWGQNYNADELLEMASISPFGSPGHVEHLVSAILSEVVVAKDGKELQKKIAEILLRCKISFATMLQQLDSVARIPAEFDYGRDGLDALTYHLNGGVCRSGIEALQAVLKRFDDDEKKPQEAPRHRSGALKVDTSD
jgi:hypothetical protein